MHRVCSSREGGYEVSEGANASSQAYLPVKSQLPVLPVPGRCFVSTHCSYLDLQEDWVIVGPCGQFHSQFPYSCQGVDGKGGLSLGKCILFPRRN